MARKQIQPSYSKGERFQDYVENLFPDEEFILKRKTHSSRTLQKRFVENGIYPDLTFEHRETGYIFSIECKWRNRFREKDRIFWAKRKSLNHYREFEKENHEVYVAIGVGGKPENPKILYLIPLMDILGCYLEKTFLMNYIRPKDHKFVIDKECLR
jgi:hypothetical protein